MDIFKLSVNVGEVFKTSVLPDPVVVAEIVNVPLPVIVDGFTSMNEGTTSPTEVTVPEGTVCHEVDPDPSVCRNCPGVPILGEVKLCIYPLVGLLW